MSLSSNANVWNTCLLVLRSRGFSLEIVGEVEPDGSYPVDRFYIAHKDGFRFCAYNPIELLGLTAVYDYVQPTENCPYWWGVPGPDIDSELLEVAFPDEDKEPVTTPRVVSPDVEC